MKNLVVKQEGGRYFVYLPILGKVLYTAFSKKEARKWIEDYAYLWA